MTSKQSTNNTKEIYEERIPHLEAELSLAQQVYAQLQKQENLLLKEESLFSVTRDRMADSLNLPLDSPVF